MTKATSPNQILKVPQAVAETSEGNVPATPDFTILGAVGAVNSISIKKDGGWQDVSQIGSESLVSLIQGLQTYETQVKMAILNSNFVKRLVNASNPSSPAGLVDEPMSIIFSILLNGVENFIICKGSKIKDGELSREAGKADVWTVAFTHTNIAIPTTSAPAGATFVTSPPSGSVWSSYSGGANPVSWNAGALDIKKIGVKFNRSTAPYHTVGNLDPIGSLPHGYRITFDFDNIWSATTLESDFYAGTSRTLAIVVKSSTSTLTLSSAFLTAYNRDADSGSGDPIVESCSGKCLTASIT